MDEAKFLLAPAGQALVKTPRRLQEVERALYVSLQEDSRAGDRAIDVTFRGQMYDAGRLKAIEQHVKCRPIANVYLFEGIPRAAGNAVEGMQIGGISELVGVDDDGAALLDEVAADGRADKARASGHDDTRRWSAVCHGTPLN